MSDIPKFKSDWLYFLELCEMHGLLKVDRIMDKVVRNLPELVWGLLIARVAKEVLG